MDFGDAFSSIKIATLTDVKNDNPKGMRLPQWGPDVVIRVQKPDENSKMTAPYLYVESRFGRVPWKETMIELFSNKWELVQVEKYEQKTFTEKILAEDMTSENDGSGRTCSQVADQKAENLTNKKFPVSPNTELEENGREKE